jgi:hypothetical protein
VVNTTVTDVHHGLQKTVSATGLVESMAGGRFFVTDQRSRTSTFGFLTIDLGTACGVAMVRATCSGTAPGAGYLSQFAEWMVTRAGVGAVTLTSIHAQNTGGAGVAPISAAVVGNTVVLSYNYQGSSANIFNSTVEVQATSGDTGPQTVTVTVN